MTKGNILRKYRKQSGLNQKKMAEKIGISFGAVSNIETSKRGMPHKVKTYLQSNYSLTSEELKILELNDEVKLNNSKNTVESKLVSINSLVEEIEHLKEENKYLMAQKYVGNNKKTQQEKTKEFFKVNSFRNDFETTSRIIKTMWDLNDESNKYFSELLMLLSINDVNENIKMKKGITKIAGNLREMSDKLLEFINESDDIVID